MLCRVGRRSRREPDLTRSPIRAEAALGWRIPIPVGSRPKAADLIGAELIDSGAYRCPSHRFGPCPRGGLDFMYGDAFPHETNMDRLHGG